MPGRHDVTSLQRGHDATRCRGSDGHDPMISGGAAYPVARKRNALEIRTPQFLDNLTGRQEARRIRDATSHQHRCAAYASGHSPESVNATRCRWLVRSRADAVEVNGPTSDAKCVRSPQANPKTHGPAANYSEIYFAARHNGCGLTRGPDNSTTTHQDERQPRAVKLMRVRRATARGSHNISARKAVGFSPELNETAPNAR